MFLNTLLADMHVYFIFWSSGISATLPLWLLKRGMKVQAVSCRQGIQIHPWITPLLAKGCQRYSN